MANFSTMRIGINTAPPRHYHKPTAISGVKRSKYDGATLRAIRANGQHQECERRREAAK